MATGTNVFISYASDTKPLAEELTRALESQGIEPWVDFKDLQPGHRWREELEQAIDAAPFLRNWVSLRIDPEREASTWTGDVVGALSNLRNEAAHGIDPHSREE